MSGRTPRVLVGLMHVDEPTVVRARAAVHQQHDVDITMFELANLPQRAAHQQLYERFTSGGPEYDLIVKVDGDMIISHTGLFAAITTLMVEHPSLDHLALGVDDWFSGERIYGMMFWRSGVRWLEKPRELATDLVRTDVREELKILDAGRQLVTHGEDPTPSPAVRYGAHRALKARASLKGHRIVRTTDFVRWTVLNPHPARLLAVAAMEFCLLDPEAGLRFTSGAIDEGRIARLQRRAVEPDLPDAVLALLNDLDRQRIARSQEDRSARRSSAVIRRAVGRIARTVRRAAPLATTDEGAARREARRARFIELLDG